MKSILAISILIAILLTAGCTDRSGLSPKIKLPDRYNTTIKSVSHYKSYRWWSEFGDKQLDSLVDKALKNNSDIKSAAEKLLEMKAEFLGSHSNLFPSVYMNLDISRQRQNVSGSRAISYYLNSFHPFFSVSYEVDLWRRLSSSDRAARIALLKSSENRRTVIHSIISDLIDLYLEISSIKKRIEILKKEKAILKDIVAIQKQRYKIGISSLSDLTKSRSEFANKEMEISSLTQQLYDKKYKLMVILGEYPNNKKKYKLFEFKKVALPILADLPSSLILKRPDVRANWLDVKRMRLLVKSAHAARFPQIKLTGNYGTESNELKNILKPESVLWQIASGITAPLFDAGKLRSSEIAALHRYNEAVINYAKSLITAFYEVQNGLRSNEILIKKMQYADNLLKEAAIQKSIASKRYKRGLDDLITFYNVKMNYYQASDLLNQTYLAFYLNRVLLHKALGGSWIDKGRY